jgi:molybdenum cofactor cytidylyltransferase
MIWAVVLAAGESKRMGAPKLLLPFRGRTILEDVIETVLRSPVGRTLVVLGANEDKIGAVLDPYPVSRAANPDYRLGMLSSVQCGIRHLPSEARAALVFLGDQPGLPPGTIAAVLDAYRSTGKGLVLPVRGHSGGHPLLIDMKYRAAVEALDPAVGLKDLLALHPSDVERVEVEDEAFLIDIDTPEDYRRALSRPDGASKKPID